MASTPNDVDEELDKKNDEELTAISERKYPGTSPAEISQAKIILLNRQREREKNVTKTTLSIRRMTLFILIFTIGIAVLTALLVYFAVTDRMVPKPANAIEFFPFNQYPPEPKPLAPDQKETNPHTTKKSEEHVPRP